MSLFLLHTDLEKENDTNSQKNFSLVIKPICSRAKNSIQQRESNIFVSPLTCKMILCHFHAKKDRPFLFFSFFKERFQYFLHCVTIETGKRNSENIILSSLKLMKWPHPARLRELHHNGFSMFKCRLNIFLFL